MAASDWEEVAQAVDIWIGGVLDADAPIAAAEKTKA
jgi:hypothetical protein